MVNDNEVKLAYDLLAYLFAAGYDSSAHKKALKTTKQLAAILEEDALNKTAVL